jgi:hypothetical protein
MFKSPLAARTRPRLNLNSSESGVRKRTGNVGRWRDGQMVLRWVAGAYLLTERNFHKLQGYRDLWALAALLGREKQRMTLKEQFA